MKAIRIQEFGGPEVMVMEEVADPVPGPGQVLVRVRAAGVNPVDTYVRSGTYALKPNLPYTPGMDAAGEVEAVGDGVGHVAKGDRVYTAGSLSGAYAELTLCAEFQVYPLPEKTSFGQGAALGIPYGTAHRALFHHGKVRPGETVLVHGASGGVGIAAVELARAHGLTVVATAGTDRGRELVLEHGAHHVVDHYDEGHLQDAASYASGGFEIILEMLADVNLGQNLGALSRGGRVVVIGSRGNVEINPRDLMMRDASIIGMSLVNLSNEDRDGIHAGLRAGLENGSLCPVVGKEMPLAEAPQAHRDVIESRAYGKIVLVP